MRELVAEYDCFISADTSNSLQLIDCTDIPCYDGCRIIEAKYKHRAPKLSMTIDYPKYERMAKPDSSTQTSVLTTVHPDDIYSMHIVYFKDRKAYFVPVFRPILKTYTSKDVDCGDKMLRKFEKITYEQAREINDSLERFKTVKFIDTAISEIDKIRDPWIISALNHLSFDEIESHRSQLICKSNEIICHNKPVMDCVINKLLNPKKIFRNYELPLCSSNVSDQRFESNSENERLAKGHRKKSLPLTVMNKRKRKVESNEEPLQTKRLILDTNISDLNQAVNETYFERPSMLVKSELVDNAIGAEFREELTSTGSEKEFSPITMDNNSNQLSDSDVMSDIIRENVQQFVEFELKKECVIPVIDSALKLKLKIEASDCVNYNQLRDLPSDQLIEILKANITTFLEDANAKRINVKCLNTDATYSFQDLYLSNNDDVRKDWKLVEKILNMIDLHNGCFKLGELKEALKKDPNTRAFADAHLLKDKLHKYCDVGNRGKYYLKHTGSVKQK